MLRSREFLRKKSIIIALAFVMAFFASGFAVPEVYAAAINADTGSEVIRAEAWSLEEAAEKTRTFFKQRVEQFTVCYYSDDAIDYDTLNLLHKMIFEPTGVSDEGDYLRDCVRHFSLSASGGQRVNGKRKYELEYEAVFLTTVDEEKAIREKLAAVYQELGLNSGVSRTDYEKTVLVYDYITTHVSYDFDHLNDENYLPQFSAYNALILGKAVCHGYALLLYRMLLDQGLDARLVGGYGVNSDLVSGSHAWNIVRIDGNYYFLDATWDAGGYHDYFLYGTNDPKRHSLSDEYASTEFTEKYPVSEITYEEWLAEQPVTGWQVVEGNTYYFNETGKAVTGVQTIDGKKYIFNSDGVMQTGWLSRSGKKYYFGKDGAMVTGKQVINGKTYYFNSKGVMHTGWITSGGKKYYFGKDGILVTGKQVINGKIYYFNSKGVMYTGWITAKGKKYYFGKDGAMVTGTKVYSGVTYVFAETGELISVE